MVLINRKVVEHVPPPDPQDLLAEELERRTGATAGAGQDEGTPQRENGSASNDPQASSSALGADGSLDVPDPDVFYMEKTGEIFLDYE